MLINVCHHCFVDLMVRPQILQLGIRFLTQVERITASKRRQRQYSEHKNQSHFFPTEVQRPLPHIHQNREANRNSRGLDRREELLDIRVSSKRRPLRRNTRDSAPCTRRTFHSRFPSDNSRPESRETSRTRDRVPASEFPLLVTWDT